MDRLFIITVDGRIAATDNGSLEGTPFGSEEELQELLQGWPMCRLINLWNRMSGVRQVSKFENRAIAVARIWRALQPHQRPIGKQTQSRNRRRRPLLALPREASKAARVVALLRQPKGASIDEIMAATEWQAHSVRGFISGNLATKRGLKVRSERLEA